VAAVAIIGFNALLWSGHVSPGGWDNPLAAPFGHPFLSDPFNPMLLAPFAFGMLFALWGRWIPVSGWLALVGIVVALVTYDLGGWNVGGQYGLLYFLMWAAIRWTPLQHWERFGDFSYGVYIFAWPLMQFCCYFGLQERGMLVYFAVIALATHALAFGSWHLIEKPAMSLKDWSPTLFLARLRGVGPGLPHPDQATVPDQPALAGLATVPAAAGAPEGERVP
jgi:peptidoglycan/LPS O-acetylase OafA/YrhL